MGQLRPLTAPAPATRGKVLVRCYAELNDYLPADHRQRDLAIPLSTAASTGQLLIALGIPAAAVEIALVNGFTSALDRPLRDGDLVSLYPMFESVDVTPLLRLRERPLRRVRFVADAHMGRLARYLRLLGFDTLFENDPGDAALARISARAGRILLSRDRRLLARRDLSHGLWIPALRPRDQLTYVIDRLDLYRLFRPFTRCTICNAKLRKVDEDISDLPVPPRIKAELDSFLRCGDCGRVYWKGSHYDRLRSFVEQLTDGRTQPGGW